MPESHSKDILVTVVIAVAVGVVLMAVARRLRLPGIVVLLLAGIALGPAGLGFVQADALGGGLLVIVELAVGLILFEGGLTLDVSGYRSAPQMIKRLLTVGVLVTWFGTAVAILLLVGLPFPEAVVAGSLVIVTGPTVIAPLLKRIRVSTKLSSILHWEGVLIDPIGVFIAVLCFEWLAEGAAGGAILNLGVRVASGLAIGGIGGFAVVQVVRRRLVPEDMINTIVLAGALGTFGAAELVATHAGLLSVTVAGFVLGISGSHRIKRVREFKAELTDVLIGTLFILLASRLEFAQFREFGLRGALAVVAVMLIVRPLSIVLCSIGLDVSRRERLFLSWVAPRGIVAASMASLFAINMERLDGIEEPRFVETFTYSVIIATIVLQGLSAGWFARRLGLQRPAPTGWLIIGAHAFARRIARFIERVAGCPVMLVDTNPRSIRRAEALGLKAIRGDARDPVLQERPELQAVGNVLMLTDNEDLNVRLCQLWAGVVGGENVLRCDPSARAAESDEETPWSIVWPALPRPSLIAGELQRGEARLREGAASDTELIGEATPLLTWSDQRIRFDPDPKRDGDAPTLYLVRAADHLQRAMHPDLVMTLEVASRRELLAHLVDRLVDLHPELPREAIVEDLIEREAAAPTTLGHGVAVPHAFTRALSVRRCVLARVPAGVDLDAYDDEPVRLVFLLLSPPGDPEGHLATLADIARRVARTDVRERLVAAETPAEVMRVVRESGYGGGESPDAPRV